MPPQMVGRAQYRFFLDAGAEPWYGSRTGRIARVVVPACAYHITQRGDRADPRCLSHGRSGGRDGGSCRAAVAGRAKTALAHEKEENNWYCVLTFP